MLDLVDLPWLPEQPADFREQLKSLPLADQPWSQAQFLARNRLKAPQLRSLSKAIAKLDASNTGALSPFRLAVLSNTTFDFVTDVLPATAARHGVALELMQAPLDQVEQQAFNPASETFAYTPDAVLLALDHRWLGFEALYADPQTAEKAVSDALERLEGIAGSLLENGGGTPIFCSVAELKTPLFGSFDRRFDGSPNFLIRRFNAGLAELAGQYNAAIFDQDALAAQIGYARWHDSQLYDLYKLPFTPDAIPLYADWLGRLIGALRGKMGKCLVLDLDNTCWGGVIGDDGLDGIVLGPESPRGEAFLRVQQTAANLKRRGIVLAVSSKNDEANARLPFKEHPDMVLRESDIAVFQANWNDKASNLEAIAGALNIGIDTLVFLDDNPAERAQVRAALPQVCVPELPSDPAHYADYLMAAGYFEAVSFSTEDSERADSYTSNALRVEVQKKSRNLGDYLSSLGMEVEHSAFDAMGRARISQLVNKSNQFNLTTRRYNEAQIKAFEEDPSAFTLQTRLQDRFGNLGMIGVVIALTDKHDPTAWRIDSWLMSCRVLGRKVEECMMAQLVRAARDAGIETVYADYIPSAKNGMVAEHFDKLGFTLVSTGEDGTKSYTLSTSDYALPELPMAVSWIGA